MGKRFLACTRAPGHRIRTLTHGNTYRHMCCTGKSNCVVGEVHKKKSKTTYAHRRR
jgi:hypothetical protein